MHIDFSYEYAPEEFRSYDLEGLAEYILRAEERAENTEASVSFVTNEVIHLLNRDYRGIDRPTDVLSFECDGVSDDFEGLFEDAPFELGDIVIASDIAASQSVEFGTSVRGEVELLLTHGLLHLCGYDHMEDEEAEAMEAREAELLAAWRER